MDKKHGNSVYSVMLEPKSLQTLALQTVYRHRKVLPWKALPNSLTARFKFPVLEWYQQFEIDAFASDDSSCDESDNESVDESDNEFADESDNESADESVDETADKFVDESNYDFLTRFSLGETWLFAY